MSTGISMSSVNKIKELADNGDYSLALDILEHQDLSKSLSPQFIRICGEVYYENKRYSEARAALVKAHSMAPVGNKIIYSIIKLYLSMGLWDLAETYYDIYKFNQNGKDAGTYQIEYMLAKAHRKPVNELYSILISANDLEADENWNFEMILLYAYIKDKEKYANACEEFKAKYRNSSRLHMFEELFDDTEKVESMIYCYPTEQRADDDEEQNETRAFEQKVLAEDDLRLHPKDAVIKIMVEDDAPVSNTMKFKQMWIRSKDKKEQKKANKAAEALENGGETKKTRGLFGRMSRKEEELVEKEFEGLLDEKLDKEQLLAEVLTKSDEEKTAMHEEVRTEEIVEDEELRKPLADDMVELDGELSPEESARYNADKTGNDDDEDSYVIEEEPEEVVMVDFDLFDEEDEEKSSGGEETFEPEFEQDDSDEDFDFDTEVRQIPEDEAEALAADEPEISETEISAAEASEPETVVEEAEPEVETSEPTVEEAEPETIEALAADEPEVSETEISAAEVSEPEIPVTEVSEPEEAVEEAEAEKAETEIVAEEADTPQEFDFDKAFETLDEFEVDDDIEDFGEDDFAESIEVEMKTEDIEDSDVSEDAELVEGPEEVEYSDGADLEKSVETVPEDDDLQELPEESAQAEPESEPEPEESALAEPESEPEEAAETEPVMGDFKRYQSEEKRNTGFPVFKSSLFPDYNTEGAKLYDLHTGSNKGSIEKDEAKISESLKKEEDLIGETDRLLARLGIELNTEFKSILNFEDEETDAEDDSGVQVDERTQREEKAVEREKTSFKLKH